MKFEITNHHRNIPNEELLNDIKRVALILNKSSLTRDEYRKHGKYGANTFLRRFGSWNTALELCGLTVNTSQRAGALGGHHYSSVTDEQLLFDIRRVSSLLNTVTFTSSDYQKYGEYSKSTCLRRFGTWNHALEVAGLTPFNIIAGKEIPTDDLLHEIERIWIKIGRQPTTTDIKNGVSNYSLNTFTRRFGSWRKALEAFIEYINADRSETLVSNISLAQVKKNNSRKGIACSSRLIKHKTQREPNLRLRFEVLQRDHFKCCICGASPAKDPSVELHIDHIIPWSKGGETVLENLQTLCSKCNLGKSDIL